MAKGDKVRVGTLLADADGIVSADVHSSVSGEVLKVEEIEGEFGYLEQMITIRVEGDEWEPSIDRTPGIVREIGASPEEIIAKTAKPALSAWAGQGIRPD